jgi:hypothetical protein
MAGLHQCLVIYHYLYSYVLVVFTSSDYFCIEGLSDMSIVAYVYFLLPLTWYIIFHTFPFHWCLCLRGVLITDQKIV